MKPKILFYGTPDFSVPALRALHEKDFNIIGVVTAPDKKSGRGMKVTMSAVKAAAQELGIPVFQPTNLKSENFQQTLKELSPDIQIIIAFRMLPESVWSFPPMGTFNLHASLLPDYRGAAPINHAIINGESETGLTTFFLKHEIDTGSILLQEKMTIEPEDTVGSLYEKMKNKGADLVVRTLQGVIDGSLTPRPQGQPRPGTHAPKITKEFCEIDFGKTAQEVVNFIRGLSPIPSARTSLNGKLLKIYSAETSDISIPQGQFESRNGKLYAGCSNGSILIRELQLEGKKRMDTETFLLGNQI